MPRFAKFREAKFCSLCHNVRLTTATGTTLLSLTPGSNTTSRNLALSSIPFVKNSRNGKLCWSCTLENNRGPAGSACTGLAILVVSVRCLSRRRASASQTQRRTSWSRRAPGKHTAGYHSSSETPTAELDHFFASPLLTSPDINLFRLVCLA